MIDGLVYVHITGGTFAILAGGLALLARKGEGLHRLAGSAFFVAMVVMCTSAFIVAVARGQTINIYASTITLYLIATAWMAARRRDHEIGRFESLALVGALVIAGSVVFTVGSASKALAQFLYVFAFIAGFAAAFDVSAIVRGGVAGAQRIARHLWRMTFAMFVATGSFFLGQPKFIPEEVREVYLNTVPPVLVIVLLVYWLARVLLTKWYRAEAGAQEPPVQATYAKAD